MSERDRVFKKVKQTANRARIMSKKIQKRTLAEAPKINRQLKKDTLKAMTDAIKVTRDLTGSSGNRLDLIKKLYELKTAGIITDREFQAKKKQILDKIG